LVVIPLGILLAVKLIPPEIMAEHRAAADKATAKPTSRIATAVIVAMWVAAAAFLISAFWPWKTLLVDNWQLPDFT